MKILITGSTGFLGANLMKFLQRQGLDCIGASRSEIHSKGQIEFDLASGCTPRLLACLPDVDVLVHAAWSSTPSQSNGNPAEDCSVNVAGTVQLFQECARAKVKKIIFASSGGQVYGDVDSASINESFPTNPKSSYGVGKLSCEKYLSLFADLYGICAYSLRVANLYGPGQIAKAGFGVIPTFSDRIRGNQPITIFGSGEGVRDFVFIDDVVDAFYKAIGSDDGGVYNIGSGVGTSVNQLVGLIEAASGRLAAIVRQPARASDPKAVVLDVGKAKSHLMWRSRIALHEGLALTLNGR